jgi:hypothetical protein
MKRVKVLFLAANPSDTTRLRVDEERRGLEAEIRKSPNRDALELIYEPAVRPGDLVEALRRHRPDVVHFGGHGSEDNEIVLEAADGSARLVGSDALVELLRVQGDSVRVVVLDACYSREQARALTRHVDCAIGMSRAIPDETALAFASAFYQGLAYGESVRTAFDSSLLQIRLLDAPAWHGEPARDMRKVPPDPAPIPELIERPGTDASLLILAPARTADEGPPVVAPPPAPTESAPVEPRRGGRRVRPSRGLPIDRDLGGLVGLLLVMVGGLGLGVQLAQVAEIRLQAVPAGPAWLWPAMGLVLAVGVLLLGPCPYRRSRLLRPESLRLRNDDPAHFRGRDEDVERLIGCCRNHPLTCLVGESGAGKSAVVRVGLGLHWPADAPLTPILIDQWGHDWVDGPREALAEAFRGLGRRRGKFLLIFDQLDDDQVRHRAHFLEDGGSVWKSVDTIVAANPFWAEVRRLVAERRLHCLFVTRSDASIGLDSVKVFSPPRDYELGRLPVDDVRPLLDELTEPGPAGPVVSDPAFGWDKLKERLARDLAVDGLVLPIQMRVALQALRHLPDLTVASYERAGGLRGLEALAIERQVAEVATALRLDKTQVLDMLLALVDRQTQKTVSMAEDELVTCVARGSDGADAPALRRALGMLEDREVVRRTVAAGTGGVARVLDHDYLWRGVVEAERRADRWQVLMRDSYREWDEARGQLVRRWWTGLLEPWTQGVLLYQRLRGRLRYGEASGYAARSVVRVLPYLALGAVTWGGVAWELDQRAAATARGLLNGIGGSDYITDLEMSQLRELALQPQSVRRKFLEIGLSTPETAERLRLRCESIARSVVGLDAAMRERVVQDLLVAKMADEDADWKVRLTSFRLGHSLYASDVNEHFQDAAPSVFLQSAGKLYDSIELSNIREAFTLVGRTLDEPQAAEVAAQLLAAIRQSTDPDQLQALSGALTAVAAKLDATQAAEVAAQLLTAIKQTTDPSALQVLSWAFASVDHASSTDEITEVFRRCVAIKRADVYHPEWDRLPPLLETMPGRIDDRELMNFLKSPECVGPLQAATVGRLGRQLEPDVDFHGNVWEVIRHPAYAPFARTPYVPPRPLTTSRE